MPDSKSTPAASGFSMPAEWERHEATWLGWPHNPTDWPDKLDTIRWVYCEMVRRISAGEIVRILVNSPSQRDLAKKYLNRSGLSLDRVEFFIHSGVSDWLPRARFEGFGVFAMMGMLLGALSV